MGLGIEARLGQLVAAAGGPERYALPSGGRASPCPAYMHAMRACYRSRLPGHDVDDDDQSVGCGVCACVRENHRSPAAKGAIDGAQRLVDSREPASMGRLFKALAITHGSLTTPPPFQEPELPPSE
jgi:hypothetical protein